MASTRHFLRISTKSRGIEGSGQGRLTSALGNGSLDVQVAPEQNLTAFREGLKHNPDVTVVELPGLNHMFQTAKTGARGEYRDIEETFAPVALDLVRGWVTARFASR